MSSRTTPDEIDYEEDACEYCRRLPFEHFMESVAQSTQRKISDVAFDLMRLERPEIQAFGELLIQFVRKGRRRPVRVVPDNMVVVCTTPIQARTSYALGKQPMGPFWVLEYLSKSNERKDYEDSYQKYEKDLKVPYYLMFHPDHQELTLYRHNGEEYVSVKPNAHGRLAVEELEVEVAILDGYVRFWFRRKLLPLPGEMQLELDQAQAALQEVKADLEKERLARESLERQVELLRAQLNQGGPPKTP